MRTKIIMLFSLCLLLAGRANAQWVVTDPTNLAQGIVNTTKQIIQTSSTAQNMINNFKETVKIYEQGKKYYDALKAVNNLVKDARKVQKTILMIGEISDTYVVSFQKMMRDENYTVEELGAIAFGYTKLLEESNDVLQEMKGAHGRGGQVLQFSKAIPQSGGLLYQQEYCGELPACQEKGGYEPGAGSLRGCQ